jgi:hypothetical protein
MFKNKHVVIAMLIAPLLALGAYFLTDFIVSEDSIAAEEGQAYPMLAKSNCRYQSGVCTLSNGEIELKLRVIQQADGQEILKVKTNRELEGARVALLTPFYEGAPIPLQQPTDGEAFWSAALDQNKQDVQELRLAVKSEGVMFYATTSTEFFFLGSQYPQPNW